MSRRVALHPGGGFVHPRGSGLERGVGSVAPALKRQVAAVEVAMRPHVAQDGIVDARVVFPVGRTNPNVGNIAYFAQNLLDVLIAFGQVAHEELVAAKTNDDERGICLAQEVLQRVGLGPKLRCAAIP